MKREDWVDECRHRLIMLKRCDQHAEIFKEMPAECEWAPVRVAPFVVGAVGFQVALTGNPGAPRNQAGREQNTLVINKMQDLAPRRRPLSPLADTHAGSATELGCLYPVRFTAHISISTR